MRELTHKHWIVAVLLLLAPQFATVANAVGLGRMNVLSALGQPFSAEIELVNVQPGELASLTARLAAPDDYQKANLQFNAALSSLRLSIDKRPNGTPFIRATSGRAVGEPFLDLLIELQWAGGRIVREYSALLDPPGLERPAPVAAAPAATPIARPAPAAKEPAPVAAPRAPAAAAPAAPAAPSAPAAQVRNEYTVKPGDTMGLIAASVKPDGVSLEQALVGVFRANPDAFINNNINLVRSGKILRVPEKEQMAAVPQAEATRELRVQTENWNSYRGKLADAAAPAPDTKPATSGKITARVEDKAAADGAKDVVRLSKGDAAGAPGKGKDGKPAGADRVRALEEELVAREKALNEANDRVKQLEKTLKDMQKLVELKGAAAPVAPKPDAKGEAPKPAAKAEPPKAEPTKVEPPKPEPVKPADKAAPPADKPAEKAPEPKAEPPKVEKAPELPKPKPKAAPLPPPKPEPGIMDTVMDNIVPIGGGGAVLVGLGAFWALRRRKKSDAEEDDAPAFVAPAVKKEPSVAAGAAAIAAGATATAAAVSAEPVAAAPASEAVDPIEEAQVYLDHGRDVQAEDILKEAMQKDPAREDLQLKLLEIYATRNDKSSFNSLAVGYNAVTGGAGDNWTRVAAMGYALDPENALYGEGKDVTVDITAAGSGAGPDLDFDIGGGDAGSSDLGSTTDIELDSGPLDDSMEKTQVVNRGEVMSTHSSSIAVASEAEDGNAPSTMFDLELPASEAPAQAAAAKPAAEQAPMDFNIELPSLDVPAASKPAEPAAPAPSGDLDFKVDFGDLDLKLDDKAPAATAPSGEVKDAHWEDVQQKFDLARAYQEMGDKEGAKEILQEVMREGSEQQKADADKMIKSLS